MKSFKELRPFPCLACSYGTKLGLQNTKKCKVHYNKVCTDPKVLPEKELIQRYNKLIKIFYCRPLIKKETLIPVADILQKEYNVKVNLPWVEERDKFLQKLSKIIDNKTDPWYGRRWYFTKHSSLFITQDVPELVEKYHKKIKNWDEISKEIPGHPSSYYLLDKYPNKINWEILSTFIFNDLCLLDKYPEKVIWPKAITHIKTDNIEVLKRNLKHIDIYNWKIASYIIQNLKEFIIENPELYDWENQGWRIVEHNCIDDFIDYFNWKEHSVFLIDSFFRKSADTIIKYADYFNWEDNIKDMKTMLRYKKAVDFYYTNIIKQKTPHQIFTEDIKKETNKKDTIAIINGNEIITNISEDKIIVNNGTEYSIYCLKDNPVNIYKKIKDITL